MTAKAVDRAQRYTRDRPCPICAGWGSLARGSGKRCHGFLSLDGTFARCSREEYASTLRMESDNCYVHILRGECRCGSQHDPLSQISTGYAPNPAARVRQGNRREIVAKYNYRDENGALLFQAVRYEPKNFGQRRPVGHHKWKWNLDGVRRVLYRLPELCDADTTELVFLPEGEKDVDGLLKLGLVATCNPMGAGKWQQDYNEALRGRRVAILPDNDDSGQRHAAQVARWLHGIAAEVRIIELPDLPHKGDVSDWLARGGTKEQLLVLTEAAPLFIPARSPVSEIASTKPAPTPFPTSALPDAARTLVEQGSASLDAPPEFVGVPVGCENSIQHRRVRSWPPSAMIAPGVPRPVQRRRTVRRVR